MVSERDKYFFDLRGYIVVKQALNAGEVRALNAVLDHLPPLKPNDWHGNVHGHQFEKKNGINLQQIYEAGKPFECLVDHPSWIDRVKCFVGGQGTFDCQHGPLFIDENFASIRGPGDSIGLHSGAHPWTKRCQYHFHNGKFNCGQVNVLMALTPIGPGDGPTMVIPGSHKSNFVHPDFEKFCMGSASSAVDGCEGALEVQMDPGDALLFVDAIAHGSALRVNPGERRIVVYRYGPSWGFFRHGYRPSQELLARLTPERRKIVWPHEELKRPQGAPRSEGQGVRMGKFQQCSVSSVPLG